jgi:hypothetical protein
MSIASLKMYGYAGFASSYIHSLDQSVVSTATLAPFTQRQFELFSNTSLAHEYLDLVLWVRYLRKYSYMPCMYMYIRKLAHLVVAIS